MHKGNFVLAAGFLIASALECQVLSPPEILDPAMRALQEKHFPALKAAAVDISSHQYPYKFYLSRTLDLTEKQEQLTDQRSIRFANFQGRTVLQVTGNYFAAYPGDFMNQNDRVKQTYLDVVLPILRAAAPRLEKEPAISAFAIEVSHHVLRRVLGVGVEKPENLALIVPWAVAQKVVMSTDINDQIAALKESVVYVDSFPVSLWPEQNAVASAKAGRESQEKESISSGLLSKPAALAATILHEPAPTPPPAASVAARETSPEALRGQQASYQETLDQVVRELDAQAHFVSYAPPTLISFHKMSYLQLSLTTTLAPSDVGSQYRMAALAFDRHVSHVIRPVLRYFKQDPEFDGIVFSSTVRVPGKTADATLTQSVEFFLAMAELRRYEQFDVTGQQLINSGFVLINGERVSLDLQSAESDIR